MATAAVIVRGALLDLGIVNELSPSDSFLEEEFFNALIRLLNRWAAANISLGITIPTVPASELGNPESVEDCLMASLAISGQKIAKVKASPDLRKDQKVYYRQMKAAFGLWPEQSMPSSMPIGQGNNLGPRTKRFFPGVDAVGSDSDTSLGT